MCANTCRIISVTPLTSSLADLSVRNTFHLLRRSASRQAVYICSHLLRLSVPYNLINRYGNCFPTKCCVQILQPYILSPDRPAIKKCVERRLSESVCWSLIGAWWFVSVELFISRFNLRGTVLSCMYCTSLTPPGVHSVTDRGDSFTHSEYCGDLQACHPSRPSPRSFIFRFSLILFMKCLMVSRVTLFSLSALICLGSCNHCS
jgi:hypothetical protein